MLSMEFESPPDVNAKECLEDLTCGWDPETRHQFFRYLQTAVLHAKSAESMQGSACDEKREAERLIAAEHLALCIGMLAQYSSTMSLGKKVRDLYMLAGLRITINLHSGVTNADLKQTSEDIEEAATRIKLEKEYDPYVQSLFPDDSDEREWSEQEKREETQETIRLSIFQRIHQCMKNLRNTIV